MMIEDEIQVKGFSSTFHKSMVNLYVTYKWFDEEINTVFSTYNLLAQHFNVLRILQGKHPEKCTVKEIKEVMMDKGRDVTRLLDKLVKLGLVERELNPENRRQMSISLRDAGLILVKKVNGELMGKIKSLDNLTEEEANQLNFLLDKLRNQ